MRVHIQDARTGPTLRAPVGPGQHVDELLAGQMPALEQKRHAEGPREFDRRRAHLRLAGRPPAEQHRGLVEIRRHQRGQRQQLVTHRRHRIGLQQRRAARRHHHRIDHGGDAAPLAQQVRDDRHDRGVEQHPGFHYTHVEEPEDLPHLLAHKRRFQRHDRAHAVGILGRQAGERAGPEHAVGREGQQVGLHAGAASAVGAGNRERHREIGHAESKAAGRRGRNTILGPAENFHSM